MKRNDIIELDIKSYAFEGKGVAKILKEDKSNENKPAKKYVIFVNGAYPGDKVKAKIRKAKRTFAEANVEEIISSSENRVEAKCKYFGTCGGCKQQDLDYKIQTKYKEEQVRDIFERMGGLKDFEFLPIIPAEKIFYYRNKMEFSFADQRWLSPEEINSGEEIKDKNFAVGLHIPGMYDKVLDIDECYLQSEISTKILNFTRDFFKERNESIYSTKTHTGYLRNLVIKESHHTKDLMVNLVTSNKNERLFINFMDQLKNSFPEITTIVNNINLKKAQVAIGDFEQVFTGNGYIFDKIGAFLFRISPNSFFQTNTLQAENLYKTALSFAGFSGNEVVYDLYSGAGTIAIYIAEQVKKVYAFESVESAVYDAEENCKLNKIENVEFIQADLNKSCMPVIEEKEIPMPDVIIADPPRIGMNPKTVKDIMKLSPQTIVYVSCNPTTQVRDIKLLTETDYELVKIQPVDMFPHTYHIENVALLKRK